MIYADYTYYIDIFGGNDLTLEEFSSVSREASAYIDRLTYNRLKHGWKVTDEVKDAACSVAEIIYKQQQSDKEIPLCISSESVDGHSVSYSAQGEQKKVKEQQRREAVDLYLPLSDPLRFAGVF